MKVDESKFGKRKQYKKGQLVKGQWVELVVKLTMPFWLFVHRISAMQTDTLLDTINRRV